MHKGPEQGAGASLVAPTTQQALASLSKRDHRGQKAVILVQKLVLKPTAAAQTVHNEPTSRLYTPTPTPSGVNMRMPTPLRGHEHYKRSERQNAESIIGRIAPRT